MTVSTASRTVSYTGDGSTTAFPVTFAFLDASHLLVQRTASGVTTNLVLGSDYTVTGAGSSSGGTVTTTSAPASGATLTITRVVPYTQGADFAPNGRFDPRSFEDALDLRTMADQQLDAGITNARAYTDTQIAAIRADFSATPDATALDERTILATGTTAPRKTKDWHGDTLNIKAFTGADPTGVTDNTTVVQAAVNAAISTGKALVGDGTYLITDTILVDNTYGFRWHGLTAYGFKLKWGLGASGRAMVKVRNSQQVWLDHLTFIGNATAGNRPSCYIESSSDTTVSRAYVPTALRVTNCDLGQAMNQADKGIRFTNAGTGSDTNNDFGFFENVRCYLTTVTAQVSIEHSQSVEHTLLNCFMCGGQYGVSNAITGNGGGFRVFGGGYGSHSVADFQVSPQGAQGTFWIQNVNSEASDRFLVGQGINNNTNPIVVMNCRYAVDSMNADNRWIKLQSAGPLLVEGCILSGVGNPGRVYVDNAATNSMAVSVRACGFVMPSSDKVDPIEFAGASNGYYRLEVSGCIGRTAGDVARAIPSYIKSSAYVGPINVQDYGATGVDDASRDDSAAFNSALSLAASSGREVIVPAGTYRLNITLPSDDNYVIRIRGEGAPAGGYTKGTILKPFTAASDVIAQSDTVFSNPTYSLENLAIYGPDTGGGTTSGYGLKINATHGVPAVTLRNIAVRDFRGTGKAGIYLHGPEDCTLDKVHVTHCYYGFDFGGAFNGNTLINLMAQTCVYGVTIDSADSNVITSAVIQSNEKSGLVINGMVDAVFTGCHFENNNSTATAGEFAIKMASSVNHSIQSIAFLDCTFNTARDSISGAGVASWTVGPIHIRGGYAAGVSSPIVTWNTYTINCSVEDFCALSQISDAGSRNRVIALDTGYLHLPGIALGGGTAFRAALSNTKTWDPSSVADGAQTTTTLTVTGAVLGNVVHPSFSLDLQGMQLTGYISAADTVTVVLFNKTGGAIDLGSGTLRADVWQH